MLCWFSVLFLPLAGLVSLYLHMNSLNIGPGPADTFYLCLSLSASLTLAPHISITDVFVVRAVYFYTLHAFDLFLLYLFCFFFLVFLALPLPLPLLLLRVLFLLFHSFM